MSSTPTEMLNQFSAVASGCAQLPNDAAAYAALSEAQLLAANDYYAASLSDLRTRGALIAGEVARRSAPVLGSDGLAQKLGHRTPEQFVKVTTGVTGVDAVKAVRVGSLMREAATEGQVDLLTGEIATVSKPWLSPVTDALGTRTISVEAADAIRSGLPDPSSATTVEQLTDAATQLVEVAQTVDPDTLRKAALALRDEIDIAGVALREEERRMRRSLRVFPQPDGTTKLVWTMDPETAATVKPLVDRLTSPKLGGVRFVDPEQSALVDRILEDDRTPEQLASDGFVQLLKLGADANPNFLLGSGAPVVKVTATKQAFETGIGIARIEGQFAPVAMSTAMRLACEGSLGGVIFNFDGNGTSLDFGREQRLFTKAQKDALALIWGGCAWPGCDRPPSWTEAHHIEHFKRDNGRTDLKLGILFCKHHHLLLHNRKWEIEVDDQGRYWLIPPAELDPDQTRIELRSKSPALRDLKREAKEHEKRLELQRNHALAT